MAGPAFKLNVKGAKLSSSVPLTQVPGISVTSRVAWIPHSLLVLDSGHSLDESTSGF